VGAATMRTRVVSPTPWAPPWVPLPDRFSRFRAVPRRSENPQGVEVAHTRVPVPPGNRFQALEARLFFPFVERVVRRLYDAESFDLIHAHFVFPEGVLGARVGKALGVPVITTEHAHWDPWLPSRPSVLRQVRAALTDIDVVTGVSGPVVDGINTLALGSVLTQVLPNVLDDRVFQPVGDEDRDEDLLLFVGVVRRVKGFDVLVRALPQLVRARPRLRVELVGDAYYPLYRQDLQDALALAERLGVRRAIHLAGPRDPGDVASAMRRAAAVVVPSRRESFSSVTMEAISCGTPVVATRCGGPEDIVEPGQGLIVEPGDPDALATAVLTVLGGQERLDAATMHEAMVRRFGRAAAASRLQTLYEQVLQRAHRP